VHGLVFHGAGDVRYERVPDPTPDGRGGAVVRVDRTAICGSDLHLYHGALGGATGFTIGHEFVGEVVETGGDVRRFRAGDRVLVSGVIGCGECVECVRGRVMRCHVSPGRVFGTSPALNGGQAEAVAVPAADCALHAIPDGVSVEQAVLLTDILPTGFFGARSGDIQPGQSVAIIGAGPVGIMALLSAQLYGPSQVFVLDRVPQRLKLALGLGAVPIDVSGDADATVRDATGGLGPDVVIEAVGARETILQALGLVRSSGVVSVVGVNFTHRMPLSEGRRAYEIFDGREDGVMKVLLDPGR